VEPRIISYLQPESEPPPTSTAQRIIGIHRRRLVSCCFVVGEEYRRGNGGTFRGDGSR
ncbi:hypothetical protein LINGRAHAP2_LOCUS23090, partial [Linum grandiflorum]